MAKDLANAIANHMLRNNRKLGIIEEVGPKKEPRICFWVENLPQAIQDALDTMGTIDVTTFQDQERQYREYPSISFDPSSICIDPSFDYISRMQSELAMGCSSQEAQQNTAIADRAGDEETNC